MSKPITLQVTLAAWIPEYTQPHEVLNLVRDGKNVRAVSQMWFYGEPNMQKFGACTRVGEADITVRLLPESEQVAIAVQRLRKELDDERAKFATKQQEILAQISKLQALEYVPEAA